MELCLLVLGPLAIALGAAALSLRLGRAPPGRAQTDWRLVGSYVLLTITFGVGTCYGSMLLRSSARAGWACAALLLGVAFAYLLAVRRLPRDDARLHEAFEVEVRHRARWPAMVALVVLGLAAAAAVLRIFGR